MSSFEYIEKIVKEHAMSVIKAEEGILLDYLEAYLDTCTFLKNVIIDVPVLKPKTELETKDDVTQLTTEFEIHERIHRSVNVCDALKALIFRYREHEKSNG